ncbi:leucyl aminopeptidase family protein [Oryzibacter oryziterrae]|uniref:leucyl aminopeptidase family protein n=1 Tax=Oryzibacter oryziterrae TaxID=2766474 RepID=UPI001F4738D6|nr:leucyl aminopeptidase family protein [Oryzibacter oryziterrae]
MPACFIAADSSLASVPVHCVSEETLAACLAALGAEGWARANAFTGATGSLLLVPGPDGRLGAVVFGLGKAGAAPQPMLAGKLATALPAGVYHFATAVDDLTYLAFGLGAYRFERYVKPKDSVVRLVLPADRDLEAIKRQVRTVCMVRDLVNTPANALGPEELASVARALAETHGATIEEHVGDGLLSANLPLIHAVGSGSPRAPRLITFVWDGTSGSTDAPKISLVGKGVVFDTGGLNIKTGNYMTLMKKDMGGAANILGLARLIMESHLPVRLRVVLPIVENAVSGASYRPGDVFRSRKGLTVEIGDTDAEGRLILADALAFADEEAPDLLIDLATLTGAARVALGPDLPPVYTRDDAFAAELATASAAVADPLWRMPLWAPYDDWLKSKVADLNNVTSGGFAGSMTAALFLGRFVERAKTWMHGDIFAWVPSAKPAQPEGGEAQTIRALFALIEGRYGKP